MIKRTSNLGLFNIFQLFSIEQKNIEFFATLLQKIRVLSEQLYAALVIGVKALFEA